MIKFLVGSQSSAVLSFCEPKPKREVIADDCLIHYFMEAKGWYMWERDKEGFFPPETV